MVKKKNETGQKQSPEVKEGNEVRGVLAKAVRIILGSWLVQKIILHYFHSWQKVTIYSFIFIFRFMLLQVIIDLESIACAAQTNSP